MNIAIFGRTFGKHFNGMAIELFETLKRKGVNVYINKKFLEFVESKMFYSPSNVKIYDKELPSSEKIDFLLSLGGDGTFLESSTLVKNSETPILGINTGRLGFLSYVSAGNLLKAIDLLMEGKFVIEKRMMLEVYSDSKFYGDLNTCLNEFAVQKKQKLHMIKTKIFADENYINTYWSDGLIIATPTGSTAYSLSCGGPIVAPMSDVFLITPIANHNLTVRPLIISAESEIKIIVDSIGGKAVASLDYRSYVIEDQKEIIVRKSNNKINFVNLYENTYFCTLRDKLMWGTDLRN